MTLPRVVQAWVEEGEPLVTLYPLRLEFCICLLELYYRIVAIETFRGEEMFDDDAEQECIEEFHQIRAWMSYWLDEGLIDEVRRFAQPDLKDLLWSEPDTVLEDRHDTQNQIAFFALHGMTSIDAPPTDREFVRLWGETNWRRISDWSYLIFSSALSWLRIYHEEAFLDPEDVVDVSDEATVISRWRLAPNGEVAQTEDGLDIRDFGLRGFMQVIAEEDDVIFEDFRRLACGCRRAEPGTMRTFCGEFDSDGDMPPGTQKSIHARLTLHLAQFVAGGLFGSYSRI